VSAFGPRAMEIAIRIGDGYISTQPEEDLVRQFRYSGGGQRPTVGLMKACYAGSREEAVGIAHRLWATSGLPGELSQLLPTPRHFEQAASLVTEEKTGHALPCGPDAKAHLEFAGRYKDAGFDELHVAAIGPHYRELIALYRDEVLPALT
ncbi:MAG: LLM class F420-dependent oxidoreductase, partial [Micromonosporaceae bacterium]